ncbi:TSCPD domain-containing protein [Desulfacinum hydrothermale DSM 13146]|uniref:ribonucleoside-diphosphate reductase n=1 Tax=Desulfacinum hydrothermale DSM 13146 TaxID=1121390 RepID=A0A1W1XY40_9BACT|nr:TSCPD domain-containing protein [Desulfacinum hydrothermale DSM 13146]
MTSTTYSIRTGCGTLHLTYVDGEILAHLSRGGSCPAAVCHAMVRTLNIALRHGASLGECARELKGIECPNALWTEGRKVTSCIDAIGILLEKVEVRRTKDVSCAA